MKSAPIESNEEERLEALRAFDILDTPFEPVFDDFTRIASQICSTPIALISLVDADRQWFKSAVGLDAPQTPRDISFCGHAIYGKDLFEVENALDDERFVDNPLVTGAPHIRFYAGQPLITSAGLGIGTLCVIDRVPHHLNESQKDTLKVLARLLVQQLETRIHLRREEELNRQLEAEIALRGKMFASASVAVLVLDGQGYIEKMSAGAARLLRRDIRTLDNKEHFSSICVPKSFLTYQSTELITAEELLKNALSHEELPTVGECRLQQDDGNTVSAHISLSVFVNELGELHNIFVFLSDLSERDALESVKHEFISVVSHELRTPLTSIRASLGLLEAGVLGDIPERATEVIKIASRNAQRLTELVNDILDAEKLMSGKMELHFVPIDLNALIRQTIEVNKGYAQTYQVTFEYVEDPALPAIIGDEGRVVQVLTNLLSNAAKFSSNGDRVDIRAISAGRVVRIEIQDYGTGIPVDFQDKIFGKFSQANNSSTRQRGGTGLGLSICQQLVQKMGGEIGFISQPNEGSVFWFSLPIGNQF